MWLSRQHPSQQDHEPFYASDATLSFTTNREEPTYHRSDSSPPATTISDGPDKRLRTANQPRSTGLELGDD